MRCVSPHSKKIKSDRRENRAALRFRGPAQGLVVKPLSNRIFLCAVPQGSRCKKVLAQADFLHVHRRQHARGRDNSTAAFPDDGETKKICRNAPVPIVGVGYEPEVFQGRQKARSGSGPLGQRDRSFMADYLWRLLAATTCRASRCGGQGATPCGWRCSCERRRAAPSA